jgi:hypothetical protein
MPNQVYLSLWLRGYTEHNMLRHFEKALNRFPFSRLAPGLTLRVYAIKFAEPPALEQRFDGEFSAADITASASEFAHADCACMVEARWDLWQYAGGWKLKPSPVTLICHGPEFPTDYGEHLLVDAGSDDLFLPAAEAPGGYRAIESNIRSLLRLSAEFREALPVEKALLWSESGEKLADRLEGLLTELGGDCV